MAAAVAPARHQSLHQLRGQLETKIEFLRPVSPFFSRAGGEKDLSVHCNPFPAREDIPPPTACQPSVSPRDRGNHVDANETSPPPLRAPTKRFHLTLFSRIDVSLPNPQTLDELSGSQSRSVKCHKQFAWAKTVVLTPCGFDYLIFFPPKKTETYFVGRESNTKIGQWCSFFVPIWCTERYATEDDNHAEV